MVHHSNRCRKAKEVPSGEFCRRRATLRKADHVKEQLRRLVESRKDNRVSKKKTSKERIKEPGLTPPGFLLKGEKSQNYVRSESVSGKL